MKIATIFTLLVASTLFTSDANAAMTYEITLTGPLDSIGKLTGDQICDDQ